ncbi:MAG: EAL domain-containing protein [Pseudomonadota bacterium]
MTNGRLLVLDDDPMTGQTIQSIAEFAGMEVRCTTSPGAFFDHVLDWGPDVIALDLIMPDMDGVQVMGELAERGCGAGIIITSGVGHRVLDAAARSASQHGLEIVGILSKPFLPAALRDLLTKARSAATARSPTTAAAALPDAAPATISLADLDEAIAEGALFVVYQPKLYCRSGSLAGFEALVRWHHPRLGVVPPDRFIPLAEGSMLMKPLTRLVLDEALEWFAGLRRDSDSGALSAQTRANITLSVNISAATLDDVALFDWLEQRCLELGLPPEQLILELTETSAMEDPVTSLDLMTRLRMKGFQLSLDDFGTGYSSMLQLVRLPFSEIKVDKSFVGTTADSEESRTVIQSVVDLGRSLGLRSTAEGVEDAGTLAYLSRIGCDMAQGYYIGKPMTGDAVLNWAHNHDATRESLRLEALRTLNLLDTPREARFDRLTGLAQRIFGVPITLVSLVDEHRQWLKSAQGLDLREIPRENSICSHTIQQSSTLIVPDTHLDTRFRNAVMVVDEPWIRFYAGYPLQVVGGSIVGTLCLVDTRPRTFTAEQEGLLRALGELVEKELVETPAAMTDPLTALLNRAGFESRARDTLKLAERLEQPATLLFVQLDGLSALEQRGGPDAADQALRGFGEALRRTFRESDLIARVGRDEFAVLMADSVAADASRARERMQRELAERGGGLGALGLALGCAAFEPHAPKDLQALLAQADSDLRS